MSEAQRAMDRAVLAAALDDFEGLVGKDISMVAELLSRTRRVHYDAHIKAGFTPEQALQLCIHTSGPPKA